MTDLLIYWRDYRRNQLSSTCDFLQRSWHSGSRLVAALQPGDRLWLVTAAAHLGLHPRTTGYLVEIWRVDRLVRNSGDDPAYPVRRYPCRVMARVDPALSPPAPLLVDDAIRPRSSPSTTPIGRLLQGPRRLREDQLARLQQLLAMPAAPTSPALPTENDASPRRNGSARGPAPLASIPGQLDVERIALGVRQPWAELILRGIKTIEVRSLETNVRGPVYLYSSKLLAETPAACSAIREHRLPHDRLPRGLLVGSVEIVGCRPCTPDDARRACVPAMLLRDRFAWLLANPQRLAPPQRPRFLPYGVWFYPFRRRGGGGSS